MQSDKRYQVFISSTFEDLKEERQAVLRAVLEIDQMPAGMELFPAADDDAWAKKLFVASLIYLTALFAALILLAAIQFRENTRAAAAGKEIPGRRPEGVTRDEGDAAQHVRVVLGQRVV